MNWLDVVLGFVLAGSVAAGLARGFIRVAIGFGAAIVGLLCGLWLYGTAGSFFLDYVSSRAVANFIGFTLVFLAILLGGTLIGKLLAIIFKWAGLSWLDRLAGGVFGLVRGVLIGTVIVLAVMAFTLKPPPKAVLDSRLAPYVVDAAHVMAMMAPRELREGFAHSYEQAKKAWEDTIKRGPVKLPAEKL
ncbi:MAG: CvpA family protein [Bryobacterales bacterium]|nr:CvpA family protein [Bryobacterales bacterium]